MTLNVLDKTLKGIRGVRVGVRMTQRQNDTVCQFGTVRHFGTQGHFNTATKRHGASL